MKVIDTKTHGILDYLVGVLLIASPWLFGFANGGIEMWLPIILGAVTLMYSLITNYELGLFKILSMKTHLAIDLAGGILLAASPWIFGFYHRVYLPHLILGVFEILAVLMSKTSPSIAYRQNLKQKPAL